MADDYDFQVNGLKFRAATSDDFPYQRGTAPFRKEQFDSAPTVGDQSLTGWWTRGQLSFHKGAGLKYYEILDGETVLNRYTTSLNVDPFTAGEVSLLPSLTDLSIAARDAVPGATAIGGGVFVLTSSGIVITGGGGDTQTLATSDAGEPGSITSDGFAVYVTNGNKIEYKASPAAQRTNFVTNPSFEVDTSGWTTVSGDLATDAVSVKYGSKSGKATNGADAVPCIRTSVTGLTVGEQYKVSAYVKNINTAPGPTTTTFSPGFSQTFLVPDGVTSLTVTAKGSVGDTGQLSSGADGPGLGGNGSTVTGTLAVTPGETLYVNVGDYGNYRGGDGGYGGAGGNSGGASDVRQGGSGLGNRVLVAAGGGGGGAGNAGGNGGAGGDTASGSAGAPGSSPGYGGGGATSSGGGSGATYYGTSGSLGAGGAGGTNSYHSGGGGGGGYYGGGGGGANASVGSGGGGGGGTSYVGGVTASSVTAGNNASVGSVSITYGTAAPPALPVRLQVHDTDTAGPTDGTYATSSTEGDWQYLTFTRTATATTEYLYLRSVDDSSGTDCEFYVDAVLLCESPFTGDYFDGSQSGCSWTGTPNASTSLYATTTGGTLTVLATLSDDTWDGVWWGKGRLWAVDSSGRWYTIPASPAGQTVASTDAFWDSQQSAISWSFSDSPSAVFISNGFDVYAVTVGTDGGVPTLTTPTTSMQVPLGEQVAAIACYLNYIVLATSRGIRVALQDGSAAILGGLVVEGDFTSTNRMGLYDTQAYVVGRPDGFGGDNVVVALDLGTPVDDLRPAWSPMWTVSELSSDLSGAIVDSSGVVYTWAAETLLSESPTSLSPSGSLTTGFHRFGTLDGKQFAQVLVRVKGTGGTVTVYTVDADGTEADVGTLSASGGERNIALTMGTPSEQLALRFKLDRDGTDAGSGPVLLGYQIKALPVPERQRLLKWPLTVMDNPRLRYGREVGKRGRAFEDLTTLEALESSSAVVTFTDHRTGETGSAYIDSVEFQSNTPSSQTSNGFGGIAYLTLRVLS